MKKKIKEKPEMLLMYRHDPATNQIFEQVVAAYPDAKNPFAEYFKEHGPIRKYSRKGNGPEIHDVKFLEKKLGIHRPVKNKETKAMNKPVYLKIKSYRVDIYKSGTGYKFVNVTYDMVDRFENKKTQLIKYNINSINYINAKKEKDIKENDQFICSLYSGEIFGYEKDWKVILR